MNRKGMVLWLSLLAPGCLAEGDVRCGPNQTLRDGLCRCREGFARISTECIEVPVVNRPDAGLGTSCSPTSACLDAQFPRCQTAPSGDSYCTSVGCSADSPCADGFVCTGAGTQSYCRRPYTGQRSKCTKDADCAAYDATYCAVAFNACLVQGCEASSCDPTWVCYDASQLLTGAPYVCVPSELVPQ